MGVSSKKEAIENGFYRYIGEAPYPKTNPAKGDRWFELDANDNYIGSWFWNGTYWLSEQLFSEKFTTSANNANSTFEFAIDNSTNVYITQMLAGFSTAVVANATNFWSWTLSRLTAAKVATTIATASNAAGQTANNWINYKTPINTHVNLSATGTVAFRLADVRTGGNSAKTGSISFEYRKARI